MISCLASLEIGKVVTKYFLGNGVIELESGIETLRYRFIDLD